MIKVLVVEDEQASRNRIASFPLWQRGIYEIVGTAENGREGLGLFREMQPDVVLTDIEMPVMDGLDMIARIREDSPDLPIIILSCYESFSYARKAVSLGVREYLLKDFMEEKSLELALEAVRKSIVFPSGAEVGSSDFLEPVFMDCLMGNQPPKPLEEAVKQYWGRDVAHSFCLLLLHLDDYAGKRSRLREIPRWISEAVDSSGRAVCTYLEGGEYVVLIAPGSLSSEKMSWGSLILHRMAAADFSCTIAVSDVFSTMKELGERFHQVRELVRYRVFFGGGRVLIPESIVSVTIQPPRYLEEQLLAFKKALEDRRREDCSQLLAKLYCEDLPGMLQYAFIERVNHRLFSILMAFMERHRISFDSSEALGSFSLSDLEGCETVQDMERLMQEVLYGMLQSGEASLLEKVRHPKVKKVVELVENRYNEDWSLEKVAEEVGVHKVYLSRLFKKETGKTYYDFLQHVRVEKAKRLLDDPGIKIYQVAEQTGFHNYDQFCVVFKKLEGLSPSEYRES